MTDPTPASGLHVLCDRCLSPMNQPGALLFSPPEGHDVKKYHICLRCYYQLWGGPE